MPFDPFLLIIAAVIGLFIFMQFRTAKKRRADAEKLQEQMVPGTEIMTNYGLYGTIVSLDDENNIAIIETTPGTQLRIHRQTILKTVDDELTDGTDADSAESGTDADSTEDPAAAGKEASTGEPEFGERVADEKKSTRKGAKKSEG
jgi:preprotein translocase subunit YajC